LIVKLNIKGIGRVSSVIGEIRHDSYEPSLPLEYSQESPENKQYDQPYIINLPTLLQRSGLVKESQLFWKGRLPCKKLKKCCCYLFTLISYPSHQSPKQHIYALFQSLPSVFGLIIASTLFGKKFDASKLQLQKLVPENQIVLSGRICSSKYVDDDGNCTFDRSEIVSSRSEDLKTEKSTDIGGQDIAKVHDKDQIIDSQATGESESREKNDADADQDECPVCRFMKAGIFFDD
jgi:hypothetical protein